MSRVSGFQMCSSLFQMRLTGSEPELPWGKESTIYVPPTKRGLSFISNRQRRKEGTFCASELAGIEPTPPAPKGAGYVRLDHSATVGNSNFNVPGSIPASGSVRQPGRSRSRSTIMIQIPDDSRRSRSGRRVNAKPSLLHLDSCHIRRRR
jgi:hypothetical protein